MSENNNQPKEYDLVLGGNNPPLNALVLGGIEGVKSRLQSNNIEDKINTLNEAIEYGNVGLNLIIEHLSDRHYNYRITDDQDWTVFLFDNLMTICESFPNLKYLGLHHLDCADLILEAILDSPLIERLSILDLSKSTITDRGAELLLNSPVVNQLYTLNVSENILSTITIDRLSNLNCKVIADSQYSDIADYYYTNHYF